MAKKIQAWALPGRHRLAVDLQGQIWWQSIHVDPVAKISEKSSTMETHGETMGIFVGKNQSGKSETPILIGKSSNYEGGSGHGASVPCTDTIR